MAHKGFVGCCRIEYNPLVEPGFHVASTCRSQKLHNISLRWYNAKDFDVELSQHTAYECEASFRESEE